MEDNQNPMIDSVPVVVQDIDEIQCEICSHDNKVCLDRLRELEEMILKFNTITQTSDGKNTVEYNVNIIVGPNGTLPSKAHLTDAGLDISSAEDCQIEPQSSRLISTEVRIQFLDENLYAKIFSRSGLAVKNGIEVGAGVIDQAYTGEIKVLLRNHGTNTFQIKKGDRIAQMVIMEYKNVSFTKVDEFTKIENINEISRGEKGFGSSGV